MKKIIRMRILIIFALIFVGFKYTNGQDLIEKLNFNIDFNIHKEYLLKNGRTYNYFVEKNEIFENPLRMNFAPEITINKTDKINTGIFYGYGISDSKVDNSNNSALCKSNSLGFIATIKYPIINKIKIYNKNALIYTKSKQWAKIDSKEELKYKINSLVISFKLGLVYELFNGFDLALYTGNNLYSYVNYHPTDGHSFNTVEGKFISKYLVSGITLGYNLK